jgi:hypothetical protein
MVDEASEGTRLIVLPSRLVERLRVLAGRKGVSLSGFVSEALEQALSAEVLGVSVEEAVDFYRLMDVQRGAGAVQVSRESLDRLIGKLYVSSGEELRGIWREAGRWYGEYLRVKLRGNDVLGFFEKALLLSWNLDEVEVKEEDGEVRLRCASFMMPLERTELLMSYVSGVMLSLGYGEVGREYLRGIVLLRYRRVGGR